MRVVLTPLVFGIYVGIAAAQAPQSAAGDSAPRFEVASVKPTSNHASALDRTVLDGPQPGGRVRFIDRTVRSLIAFAYVPGQADIVGLPDWADSDGYDVTANAEGEATVAELRRMMQTLLRERFGFQMHYETRRKPGYAVMRAESDGALGPQLRSVRADCPTVFEELAAGRLALKEVGVGGNGARLCVIQSVIRYAGARRVKTLTSGAARLSGLLPHIAADAGRPLVDKTGLEGYYEFTLEYAAAPPSTILDFGDQSATLVTALREQLGLKLVAEDVDVPALLIARIHKPTED